MQYCVCDHCFCDLSTPVQYGLLLYIYPSNPPATTLPCINSSIFMVSSYKVRQCLMVFGVVDSVINVVRVQFIDGEGEVDGSPGGLRISIVQ